MLRRDDILILLAGFCQEKNLAKPEAVKKRNFTSRGCLAGGPEAQSSRLVKP